MLIPCLVLVLTVVSSKSILERVTKANSTQLMLSCQLDSFQIELSNENLSSNFNFEALLEKTCGFALRYLAASVIIPNFWKIKSHPLSTGINTRAFATQKSFIEFKHLSLSNFNTNQTNKMVSSIFARGNLEFQD